MNYKFVRGILMIGALALLITIGHGLNAQAQDVAPASETVDMPAADGLAAANDSLDGVFGVSETGRYIIQLEDPAVPSYTGGIAGLEATSPQVTGESRLDANTPAVQAYISYLHGKQDELLADINATLGRSVELVFRYESAMNGLAVVMSHEEAVEVSQLPGVKAVFGEIEDELATDVGPWFLGAPSIWFGDTGSGVATRGEGVIVGIIDTGVNFAHPSFAATDGDGYTHTNPYGAGVYNGWCDANPGFCNDKLIGAYGLNPVGGNPADDHGHGSHTGSTAAGNLHDAVFDVGNETFMLTVAGVAPRANVVHYKVCTPGCPQTASVAAVNHAINDDMVDVLNFSISGVDNPWNSIVDLAFLEGFNAGIYIAASAGNDGPGPSSVAKTGPWNASTGASTINRIIAHTVDVVSPGTPPELQDMPAVPGENVSIVADITEEIRYNAANPEGCNPGHPAGFFDDAIALIIRGSCTFAEKVANAAAAGAEAVIVFNHVGGPPISMGGTPATPPSVMIDNVNGADLRDYIIANPGAEVTINAQTSISYNDDWENVVGGFSSRGPSQFEMLAPTFIAPGVNTLAAGAFGADDYYFSQGTSMSSPHAAGAGALLMALNPTWSPAEVRSALAMTANPDGMVKEDGATPVDWFDVGSGLLDLTAAGNIGLVMDETYDNFVDANPDIGGDPKTLNLPAFLNYNCTGECSWTRTVTSVAQDPITYTAAVDAPAGMTITVEPASFTIDPGASQVLTVTVDVDGMAIGDFAFADVKLEAVGQLVLEEDFEGTFPPTDWDVIDNGGDCVWERNDEVPDGRPNYAGGEGFSAAADSDRCGNGTTMNTELHSLLIDLSDPDAASATLDFVASYRHLGSSSFQVHVSDDGGTSWDTLLTWTASVDPTGPGTPVSLDLSPYLGSTEVMVSFHYTAPGWDYWAQVDQVRVTTQEANPAADVHMPVAVIPALAVPVITVDPDEMSASQEPDTQTSQTLTIGNDGGVDLEWTIAEAPVAMQLGLTLDDANDPAFNEAVGGGSPMSFILDDGVGDNAIGVGGAQFLWFNRFTPEDYNFPITIETVDVMFGYPGSTGGINVGELVDIYLYEDEDGDPTNGATHRASLHDQEVEAVDGVTWSSYTLTTPVTFDGPGDILIAVVNRTAGVTPDTFPAVLDQTPPSQQRSWAGYGIVPADPPVFTDFPNFTLIDAFFPGNWLVRGFGTGVLPCENPANVSWLDASPDMGTTGPDSTTDVTVTFDSAGLAFGEYSALLCIESDDPNNPLIEVPITLEVEEPVDVPEIEVSPESIESTQAQDTITSQTLTISNVGEGTLDWDIEEAEAPASGPVPMAIQNLPVGSDRTNPMTMAAAAPATILPTTGNQLFSDWSEGFDDVTLLPGLGWALINNSEPLGTTGWFQGNDAVFPSHSGDPTSYIGANFNNTSGVGTISNWLLTPEITMNNGDEFTFWTRRTDSNFEDRLQVRLSTNGDSTDVGTTATSVGDFTELLLDINPTYAPGGFPTVWTEYTITISGLSEPTDGRLAFRYFVENGGPSGSNSDYIGIDTVSYTTAAANACASPANIPWLAAAPNSGSTPAGESDEVVVTLDSTGLSTGLYEAVLCVNSNDPDTPLVEVPVTMMVEEFVAEYGVELSPATAAASGDPGEMVSYMLTITNTGNVSDTFSLMASGHDWDVDLPDDITLAAGASTTFTVVVTVPMDAEEGDMDTVTVTATSTGDPDQSASSALTTTAEAETYMLYLPIVFRE